MNNITSQQKELLDFINSFNQENGYSPTIRDISKNLNKSISTIHGLLCRLEKKGFIYRNIKNPREIKILNLNTDNKRNIVLLKENISDINFLYSAKNIEKIIEISNILKSTNPLFAIRVIQENLLEHSILKNDYAVIEEKTDFNFGDLVAFLKDDKIYIEKFALIPLQNDTIIGKVIGTYRYFL